MDRVDSHLVDYFGSFTMGQICINGFYAVFILESDGETLLEQENEEMELSCFFPFYLTNIYYWK
jgi:hypothetical protein